MEDVDRLPASMPGLGPSSCYLIACHFIAFPRCQMRLSMTGESRRKLLGFFYRDDIQYSLENFCITGRMCMIGTLINFTTVMIGGLLGLLVGDRLPERFKSIVIAGIGLITVIIGVSGAI